MSASTYIGLGDALQNISGILMRRQENKDAEAMRVKREEAAAKAAAERDKAAQERERIMPAGPRRVYQGPDGETRAEATNKFGEVVSDGLASSGEAANFTGGLKAAAEARAAEAEKLAYARSKDARMLDEKAKDRASRESAARLRAGEKTTKKTDPYISRLDEYDDEGGITGSTTIARDKVSGEELWRQGKDGNLTRASKSEGGKPRSFFGKIADNVNDAIGGLVGAAEKVRDKPRKVTTQAEADRLVKEAEAAIAAGAPRDAVMAELAKYGLSVK